MHEIMMASSTASFHGVVREVGLGFADVQGALAIEFGSTAFRRAFGSRDGGTS